ncbi:hypothetical protein C2E23DRAFT_740328 [Lenzites betulinus]|nr:hypothetical protein C2E23DRAFT_740328 [Lenzites betulinus]
MSNLVVYMDLPTMLAFRATSKQALRLVTRDLTRSLFLIVARFVPNPALLLAKLTRHNTFVSGSAGLQFFLRDLSVSPSNLDIFLPVDSLPPLLYHMLAEQGAFLIHPTPGSATIIPPPWHFLAEQGFILQTPRGMVTLWQSGVNTPFLPIVCAPTSIQILYVNPRHFGCGYPSLLFARRALIARPNVEGFDEAVTKCQHRGIELRFFTHLWPDLAHHGPCASHLYLCPSQQRTLSDAGSLKARMHPFVDPEVELNVVWRLDDRPCGYSCALPTPQLPVARLLQNML